MSHIAVVAILIGMMTVICLLLVLFYNEQKRKTMNQISLRFSRTGSENNLSFSSQEILKDCVFGLDGLNRKILLIRRSNEQYTTTVINLDEIRACSVKKLFGPINVGDLKNKKLEQHLQKIVLHFEFKDSKLPIDVPFFDHIENSIYQLSEMDRKARYWQTMLSKMIGSTAKHIA